jgi:hypothetical protein
MAMARVLLIVAAVGGLTAWVIAQGTTLPVAPAGAAATLATPPARRTARVAMDPAFDMEVSRLRDGLGVMPVPSASGRNPFRFGTARPEHPPSTALHHPAALPPGESANTDAAADRPPMQLLGVAADGENGADPVRTAVIATPRQLYLVREGEQMALRFQVVRIGSDAVELLDLASDQTFSLTLR